MFILKPRMQVRGGLEHRKKVQAQACLRAGCPERGRCFVRGSLEMSKASELDRVSVFGYWKASGATENRPVRAQRVAMLT